MILTKRALNAGLQNPLSIRYEQYKRFRKPKYASPFSKYASFVGCYGELMYKNFEE